MTKILRLIFSVFSLVTIVQFVSVVSADAQVVNEVLKRMEAHYQGLSTLRADVKMEQFTKQTGEDEIRDGKLIFVPQKGNDAAFRIDWKQPDESLSVIKKMYRLYRPALKVAYTGMVNNVGGGGRTNSALGFLNLSKVELKAKYNINYVGPEDVSGGTSTWHLQLVPKGQAKYKSADIWVDVDGMPIQMKQTEFSGDTTTVLLSHLVKNAVVKGSDIPVAFPNGVKVSKT